MAGRLKNDVRKWHTITSDQWILDAIRGVTSDFIVKPIQLFVPSQYKSNPLEIKIIAGQIEKAIHSNGEYISNIFMRPKKDLDGSYRLILNLQQLNE